MMGAKASRQPALLVPKQFSVSELSNCCISANIRQWLACLVLYEYTKLKFLCVGATGGQRAQCPPNCLELSREGGKECTGLQF